MVDNVGPEGLADFAGVRQVGQSRRNGRCLPPPRGPRSAPARTVLLVVAGQTQRLKVGEVIRVSTGPDRYSVVNMHSHRPATLTTGLCGQLEQPGLPHPAVVIRPLRLRERLPERGDLEHRYRRPTLRHDTPGHLVCLRSALPPKSHHHRSGLALDVRILLGPPYGLHNDLRRLGTCKGLRYCRTHTDPL